MTLETSKIFDISPQMEQLINFAQYGVTVYAPTAEGEVSVYLDLLWESEMLEISKRSAIVCNVADELSRSEFIKLETLVYAISRIGEDVYKDEDEDRHKALKNKLRIRLGNSSPITIDFLYDMYDTLSIHRNEDTQEKLDSLKKKNLETIKQAKPL